MRINYIGWRSHFIISFSLTIFKWHIICVISSFTCYVLCVLCVWRFVCVFVFVHMNDVNLKLEDIVFATFSFVFSVIFISSQLSISLLNKLCLFIPKFFGFGFNRCETFFSLHRCRFICFALVTSYKKNWIEINKHKMGFRSMLLSIVFFCSSSSRGFYFYFWNKVCWRKRNLHTRHIPENKKNPTRKKREKKRSKMNAWNISHFCSYEMCDDWW